MSNEPFMKSDDHYRKMRESNSGIETIVLMELEIEELIANGVPPRSALNIVLAQKHVHRASTKDGEDWCKEINKSINYLTRSTTGEWVK